MEGQPFGFVVLQDHMRHWYSADMDRIYLLRTVLVAARMGMQDEEFRDCTRHMAEEDTR